VNIVQKIQHLIEHMLQLMVCKCFDPKIVRSDAGWGPVFKVFSNIRLLVVSCSWHRQQQNHICKRNRLNNCGSKFWTVQEYLKQRDKEFQVLQNYMSYFQYHNADFVLYVSISKQ
jgi:hypothetical protein